MSCPDDTERDTRWMLIWISDRLRRYRQAQGLTVKEVAWRCGIERPNLSRIESGRANNITVRMLCKICSGLGTDLLTLLMQPVKMPGSKSRPGGKRTTSGKMSKRKAE